MPVVYGDDRPKYRTNPGAVQHYLVSKSVGASAVSIWTSEWQPGGGPTTKHTHPHEEVFLFLAGTGEGEVGDEHVTGPPRCGGHHSGAYGPLVPQHRSHADAPGGCAGVAPTTTVPPARRPRWMIRARLSASIRSGATPSCRPPRRQRAGGPSFGRWRP